MAKQLTSKATINGWKNVLVQAQADGYSGSFIANLTVVNMSSTAAYLHVTADGATNPSTAANGLPFSTDTASAPSSTITLNNVDLATTWINTASSISITYAIVGK